MHFHLKTILLPLALVLAVLVAFMSFPDLFHSVEETMTPTPAGDDLMKKAAVDGVTAFYTIEEQAGKQAWIDGICQVSTESGCALYRLGLDKLWKQFEAAHTSITSTILSVEKVDLPQNRTGQQVWKVTVELSDTLPGHAQKQDDTYVLVVLEQGAWKFDRFLTSDEAQAVAK
jgi:hypothetical protein